jgi:hypothetical protein
VLFVYQQVGVVAALENYQKFHNKGGAFERRGGNITTHLLGDTGFAECPAPEVFDNGLSAGVGCLRQGCRHRDRRQAGRDSEVCAARVGKKNSEKDYQKGNRNRRRKLHR